MGLASSKNKNVIRFLLLWIYMFPLEPAVCCAVEGSSMEKYICVTNAPIKFGAIQVAELIVTRWVLGVQNESERGWLPSLKPCLFPEQLQPVL